jgi:GntR family transcriptional regulator, rspAB operon transcriptional repressor
MDQTVSKTAPKGRRSSRSGDRAEKTHATRPTLDWQLVWNFANSAAQESPDDEPSRNEATYIEIKRLILSGHFGGGNKLVHEDLAEQLHVSRTPVREALERLYQEGFVTRLPRRGFYVARITRDEAHDLYSTREALELYALQVTLAHGPLVQPSIDRLWHYLQKYEELENSNPVTQRIIADILFHLNLAALSGNRYLVSRLAQVFELLALKRRLEGYNYSRTKLAIIEHKRLLNALTAYDKKTATQILRDHILSARDAVLSQLYETPSA